MGDSTGDGAGGGRVGGARGNKSEPRNSTLDGRGFKPRCEEVPNCGDEAVESRCFCSGMWGPYDLEIVDYVQIPADLKPGKYVLGWRWDCEESNQIWNSCSDVEISV